MQLESIPHYEEEIFITLQISIRKITNPSTTSTTHPKEKGATVLLKSLRRKTRSPRLLRLQRVKES